MKIISVLLVATLLSSCMTSQFGKLYPEGDGEEISVTQRRIVWFFATPSKQERWESLHEKAEAEAGDKDLANVSIEASWSPWSLLMYFGTLGFVEKATMTANLTDTPRGGPTSEELQAVKRGQYFVGMREEYARLVLGHPVDINRTVTENTVREQWVFDDGFDREYVYFENGILTAWQD